LSRATQIDFLVQNSALCGGVSEFLAFSFGKRSRFLKWVAAIFWSFAALDRALVAKLDFLKR
jgi:hypothetical protein